MQIRAVPVSFHKLSEQRIHFSVAVFSKVKAEMEVIIFT